MVAAFKAATSTGVGDADDTGKSIAVPTGAAADDIALLIVEAWWDTTTDPVVTATGFSQIGYVETTTDGFLRLIVLRKILTGADTGNYSYTLNQTYWNQAQCHLWSGIDLTTPLDVAIATAVTAANTTMPALNLTTVTDGCGMIHIVANENAASGTAPTSYTERTEANYLRTNTKVAGTAGSETPAGGSISVSTPKVGMLIALRPAGGGGSNLTQTPADTENLTDSIALNVGKVVSDSEGLTDTATTSLGKAITASDTEGLTDTAELAIGRGLVATDIEGLTDSIAKDAAMVLSDALGLTDSAQVQMTGAGALTFSDTEGLTDSAAIDSGKTITDSLGLTDSVQIEMFRALSVSAADTESLTDTATLARMAVLLFVDSEGLSDFQTFDVSSNQADNAGLTDTVAVSLSNVEQFADVMGLTDSVVIQLGPQQEPRDLYLTGTIVPGRFRAVVESNRFSAGIDPARWTGAVE